MRVVNHIGLTVGDLDRSVAFYTHVVGLEIQGEHFRASGDWFDTLTANSGAVIDGANLGNEGFTLQLVHYEEGGDPEAATGHNRVGNLHISVNVADAHAKRAEVVAAGVPDPTPVVEIPGGRSFYVLDPDGVPVEFMHLDHLW